MRHATNRAAFARPLSTRATSDDDQRAAARPTISQVARPSVTSPMRGMRHAGQQLLERRPRRPAAPRTETGVFDSRNSSIASAAAADRRRRSMRHVVPDRSSRPSPPAKAISASATARPPSLRSWQARTRPASIAACSAANVCLASGGIDLRHLAAGRAVRPARSASRPVRSCVCADQVQQVARLLEVHRHAPARRRRSGPGR